jgi:hypothetical protein
MPFAFPFAYALGLAMMERVAPLAIDTFVNELQRLVEWGDIRWLCLL